MGIDGCKRIVILGDGFGGLYAALRLEKTLARDPDVEILLVVRKNLFLFTPMLHEVAGSDLDLTHIVNPVRKFQYALTRLNHAGLGQISKIFDDDAPHVATRLHHTGMEHGGIGAAPTSLP
jgi:NADH dehydrogenase FAD-containing subunit